MMDLLSIDDGLEIEGNSEKTTRIVTQYCMILEISAAQPQHKYTNT
jgi:hypothetical protein